MFTKDNYKKFFLFLFSSPLLFIHLFFFAGNSHRYNKMSFWRRSRIILSKLGLVARCVCVYMCVCVCVCACVYVYMLVYVCVERGTLFSPQVKDPPSPKTIKEKEKKFQKHLVFIIFI